EGEERRQASTLASVLLVFLFIAFLIVFGTPITAMLSGEPFTLPDITIIMALVIPFIAYRLSRTQYHTYGAYLLIVTPYVAIVLTPLTRGTPTTMISLVFLTLGIIITS